MVRLPIVSNPENANEFARSICIAGICCCSSIGIKHGGMSLLFEKDATLDEMLTPEQMV